MVDDYCTFDDGKWKEKSHKQLSQKNIIDEQQLPYLKGIHFLDLKEDNGRIVDVMEEFKNILSTEFWQKRKLYECYLKVSALKF